MTEQIMEYLAQLPDRLSGHLSLSISALLIGALVSIPLGIVAARSQRWGGPILAVVGLAQTIPSIALLALMVPLLSGLIGFWPAFLALTIYSMLPILRNTATGLLDVDPNLVEAARGVGMTDRQRLVRVELPLSLPVIIAGMRTATVWVVGTATLATPVGAVSLGDFIFSGLQTRNWLMVIFGCVFAALLAIVLDQLIRLAEKAAAERNKHKGYLAGGLLALVLIGGVAPGLELPKAKTQPGAATIAAAAPSTALPLEGLSVVIGGKTFTEQFILVEFLSAYLKDQGAEIVRVGNMGSTILFDALRQNAVDISIDYTGTLYQNIVNGDGSPSRTAMLIETAHFLKSEYGILLAGRLGFENAYAIGLRRDRAQALGLTSLTQITALADQLSMGADPEFFARPEWKSLKETYGLDALGQRSMDSTFMYQAVRDGAVDLITAYTTDGRIEAFDLVLLADPKGALPPYDAVIMLSPRMAEERRLAEALQPVLGKITPGLMRKANAMVDQDGKTPTEAARWLRAELASQ